MLGKFIAIILMTVSTASAANWHEVWARMLPSGAAEWTPPYSTYIAWSATFDGTLLRKSGSDATAVNVVAPSVYARAAWSTSLSTNTDPYIGWYASQHDTSDGLLVSNLTSGNAVGILSTNSVANKFVIPNTYIADMAPAPTSATWTVAWWMKASTTVEVNDYVFVPESASPAMNAVGLYRASATQMRWASVASFNHVPTSGAWQLWVITSHRELWVNGSLINSNGTQFAQIPKRVFIGGAAGIDTTLSIPGLYDDIYYWDGKRFTQDDVTTLYNHGAPDTRAK